jgi:hypothetical protein
MKVSGQLHAPAVYSRRKNPVSIGYETWSGSCGEDKTLAPAGNGTQAVKPIARHYTD